MSFFDFNNTAGFSTRAPAVNVAKLTKQFIDDANARTDRFRQRRSQDGLKPFTHDLRHKRPVSSAEPRVNDYHKRTKTELAESLVARGIESKASCPKINKPGMVAALQRADRHPSFSRFLDLPPELRNQIYKLAIDDLHPEGKAQERPPTPAISRVNREIRSETIPLFARSTCFSVIAGASCDLTIAHLTFRLPCLLSPAETLKPFKEYIARAEASGWLQHMRSFQCELAGRMWVPDSAMTINWAKRFHVQFAQDVQSVEIRALDPDKTDIGHLEKIQTKLAGICGKHSTTMTREVLGAMMMVFEACVENVDKGLPFDKEFWKA